MEGSSKFKLIGSYLIIKCHTALGENSHDKFKNFIPTKLTVLTQKCLYLSWGKVNKKLKRKKGAGWLSAREKYPFSR